MQLTNFEGVASTVSPIKLFDWRKTNIEQLLHMLGRTTKAAAILYAVDLDYTVTIHTNGYDENEYSQYVYGQEGNIPNLRKLSNGTTIVLSWEKFTTKQKYPKFSKIAFSLNIIKGREIGDAYSGDKEIRDALRSLPKDKLIEGLLKLVCTSEYVADAECVSTGHGKFDIQLVLHTEKLATAPSGGMCVELDEYNKLMEVMV